MILLKYRSQRLSGYSRVREFGRILLTGCGLELGAMYQFEKIGTSVGCWL